MINVEHMHFSVHGWFCSAEDTLQLGLASKRHRRMLLLSCELKCDGLYCCEPSVTSTGDKFEHHNRQDNQSTPQASLKNEGKLNLRFLVVLSITSQEVLTVSKHKQGAPIQGEASTASRRCDAGGDAEGRRSASPPTEMQRGDVAETPPYLQMNTGLPGTSIRGTLHDRARPAAPAWFYRCGTASPPTERTVVFSGEEHGPPCTRPLQPSTRRCLAPSVHLEETRLYLHVLLEHKF
jgi:hypothetical protein